MDSEHNKELAGMENPNKNSSNLLSDQDVNITLGIASEPSQEILSEKADLDEDLEQQRNLEKEEWLDSLQQEQLQWDAVESLQQSSTGRMKTTTFVSFTEVLNYFQTKNLDTTKIKPTVPRSGFSAFIHFLFGPPRLNPSLMEERNLIFCIAQVQLDDSEEIHGRVLQTIYKKLTKAKFDCPRRGTHWETIGFQGNDPATDLRGIGFLGLMHLLHGVTDPNINTLFSEFYRLSLDAEQNFPFCVMSLNVTRIALQVLREEKLTRECNRRKQVIAVLNNFYVALFLHIYNVWKSQFKTMMDSGHVMEEAEKQARKNPKTILQTLEKTLKERQAVQKKQSMAPVPIMGPITPDQPFHTRRPSAASSASSTTESKNQSEDTGTPLSARFVRVKKISDDNLPEFTDILEEAKEEKVTDL